MKKRFISSVLFFVSLLLALQLAFPSVYASALSTDTVLPPSNLSIQLTTPSDVKLTWSSVYQATGYNVYGILDGQLKLLGTTTSTAYTFNNLPEGSYSYVVSTLSVDGESGPCAPVTANITYPTMSAPTNLTYKIQNGNDVVLSWTSSPYAQTYNIYQIDGNGQQTLVASTKTSSYTLTNTAEGNYTYAVSSVNALYGESSLSGNIQVQVVFPIMTAPNNFNYSISNGNDITLKWNAVNYALSYKIYQIVDGQKVLKSTASGTSISYANMPAGDYLYEIHSYSDRFGESQDGSQVSFTLVLPTMQAPSNLTYTITNGNDITLKWGTVPYAAGYKVYQIINGQKVLKSTLIGSAITYTNMDGGDYNYEIHSYSTRFGESQDGSQVSFTLVLPTIQAPSNLTYTITNGNDITLKWGTVPYAVSYKVYQIANGQETLVSTLTGTTVTYTNKPAGDYVYEIHSYSDRFGESQDGSQVSFTLVLPTMQAPSNLTYNITNGNDITLKWGTVPYAAGYKVYQIANGQETLVSTLTGTTVTYTNKPSGDYVYEVHSYSDRFGESQDGSQASFTLVIPTMQAPGNLTYNITNGNDITLSWAASPYAGSYKVYQIINGQKVLKSTLTGSAITYTNMAGGDYNYEIHSYSTRFGESQDGSSIAFTLVPPVMQPPANVIQTIKNATDFTLSWDISPYATSYKIYQIINGQPVLKSTVTGTTISFTNMLAGQYDYEIHSYSTRFGESVDSSNITVNLNGQIMQAPTNLTYSILNGNDINLKWTTVSYATSYKIYQVINGQPVLMKTVTSTSVTFTNMPQGDYDFIIDSVSSLLGESPVGAETAFSLVFPAMTAPSNFAYKLQNVNDVVLTWSAVTYAGSYKIYELIDNQLVLKTTVTSTAATLTNVAEGDHTYVVTSVSSRFGESADGSQVSLSIVFPIMQAPANLTYTIANGNDITLKWTASTYATSYNVYQIIDGQKVLKQTVTGTSVTYVNMPQGDYSYEVDSYSTRFGESPIGSQVSLTLVYPTMLSPANLTYTIANGNDIILKWTASSYAASYKVYQFVNGQKVLKQTVTGTSVTFVNVPEGDYSYEVDSYSSRFGESPVGSQINLTLVFPTMQAPTNLTSSIANGNDITLRWTASNYATAYNVYQIINGQKVLKQTLTGVSITFTNMPQGDYSYEVDSYSTRFGESPAGSTINFTLTWPVVSSPTLAAAVINVNNITFSWQAVSWANEYRIYEATNGTLQLIYKGTALTYKVYNLSEATHVYQITAYSTRFGESALSSPLTENIIYPVMQSPVVNINVLDKTSVQLTWNFVTYANGYNIYEIVNGVPVLLVKNLNNLSYTFTNLSYENHQYYVTSYSNSFGESDPSSTVLAKLITDTEPPVTSINIPTSWINQNSFNVILTAADNETGTIKTFYSIDGSDYIEGNSFIVQGEGIHMISFYSVDYAGNIEAINTVYVNMDNTAPVTTSNSPAGWSKNDVAINLTAADSLSGVYKTFYSIDGSDYLEGNSFIVQGEGIHKISFYSVDNAGNKEALNIAYVKIDTTAPTISMNLLGEYKLGSTLQLNYTASDNLSGIDNESVIVFGPNDNIGKTINNGSSLQFDKPGIYTVIVTVTDAAGNSTTVQKQFTVYIPANIEITPLVVKGNNGVLTVRVNLPSGYSTQGFDLSTATLNGVSALSSNNGYYNQAKLGQFKFDRSDFNLTAPEMVVEFRCYINGYLVIGQTVVKVLK